MARELVESPPLPEHRLRMSYDEWLAWDGSNAPKMSEWVDGEVIVFMPPDLVHHDLLAFLSEVLTRYVRQLGLGRVLNAPFEMRLTDQRRSREPDLAFLAKAHAGRATAKRLDGPADLAVEVVSDDSVARDRRDKRREYAAAGIPEYWIVDPRPRRLLAEFLRLDPDGRYREGPRDEAGRYRSVVVPGFWLDPAWFWQDPLPSPVALRAVIEAGS